MHGHLNVKFITTTITIIIIIIIIIITFCNTLLIPASYLNTAFKIQYTLH